MTPRRLPRRMRQQREAWARAALELAERALLDSPALEVPPPPSSAGAPLPTMSDEQFLAATRAWGAQLRQKGRP